MFIKKASIVGSAFALFSLTLTACFCPRVQQDLGEMDEFVFINTRVYTLAAEPWATAIAVQDGRIVAVGSNEEALAAASDSATVLDLDGQMILPGFHDVHLHVIEAGLNEATCLLPSNRSVSAYVRMIKNCAEDQPGTGWVRAAGASVSELVGDTDRPIDVLDEAIPNRPVMILDDLGHGLWANSLGLEAAGITEGEADPQGGVFHRDGQGLTGLLFESAQHRVRDVAIYSPSELDAALDLSLQTLAENGITSVSDAGGFWAQNHVEAWQRAESEGRLTVRAVNSLYLYPARDMDAQLAEMLAYYDNEGPLRFDVAKVYLDGIFDLGTALLLDDYDEAPNVDYPKGFPYFDSESLGQAVGVLHEADFALHFHAVGDGAVRLALDSIEALGVSPEDVSARRHRTSHNYLVDVADLPRFAALGMSADLQFGIGAISKSYARYLKPVLGEERAGRLLPLGALIDAGAHTVLSSDWDADDLSPLGILERAVRRKTNGTDLETAVELLTLRGAEILRQDDITGSLEVGKSADLVVLDRDIFEVWDRRIDRARVKLTMVGGEVVYQAKSFRACE